MSRRLRTRTTAGIATAVAVIGTVVIGTTAYAAPDKAPTAPGDRGAKTAPGTEKQIKRQLVQWNRTLTTGDPEKVAARYAPDAVLLPTQSNKVRTDHDGIVDYFEHFLAQQPKGEVTESHIKMLGPKYATDNGTYRFTLTGEDGGSRVVDARYTFVYEKNNHGKWKIITHHSSAMPEG
jgi:uncharacterized protein (TIGR02246 family)